MHEILWVMSQVSIQKILSVRSQMCQVMRYIGLLWNVSVYNMYLCEMEECSDAAGMYYKQVQFCVFVYLFACVHTHLCVCVCEWVYVCLCTLTEQTICDTESCLLLTGNMLLHLIKNNLVVQMQGGMKTSYDLLQIIHDLLTGFYL